MKVLFLDVDGVLNTSKSRSLFSLSKPRLRLLEEIVKDSGCEIVLSSTWRKDKEAFKHLTHVLSYRDLKIIGVTPVIHNKIRGEEIAAYLAEHPDVTKYAILDDNSDMLNDQLRNFFQTDMDYGLTKTIAYRVVYHFNN